MGSAATPATLLSAVVTTATGTGVRVASPGAQVHVYSAAGSSCTVLIQGSQDGTVWKTLKSLTDPPAEPDGFVYQGTAMPYMRAKVSARVSGTITAKLISLSSDPGPWCSIESPANTAGALTVTSLTDSGLTATRVPFAGTAGLLEDEAAFTYAKNTNTLSFDNWVGATATLSSLTNTRIPIAGTAGLLGDDSTLTFDSTLKALSATYFKGNDILGCTAKLIDGAISAIPATYFITKGSALGSSTVANPTATTHDGYVIRFISTTAYAHVVSFNSGKIDGGSNTTVTLGGAIGDGFAVVAYQGVYYMIWSRNATVS